jgi:archaemetzincin
MGVGAAAPALLQTVGQRLRAAYDCRVATAHDGARPEDAWDPRRRQHASSRVLSFLARRAPEGASRVLGVTDADLFIPVLTFVFGEAQLGGRVAVVSTARLGHGPRLPQRLATECVHELGHTYGLTHCATPRCAMARSTSLVDVDGKDPKLCPQCRALYLETGASNE